MKTKLMTVTFFSEGKDIKVTTEFDRDVPIAQFSPLTGQAIKGMMLVAERMGNAKGMTKEQITAAMFPEEAA